MLLFGMLVPLFGWLFPSGKSLLIFEALMLWAFGVSWFVKGNALRWRLFKWLRDEEDTKLKIGRNRTKS